MSARPRPMLTLVCATLLALAGTASAQGAKPYDVVIANGHVVDGTGSPWYCGGRRHSRRTDRRHRRLAGARGDAPHRRARDGRRTGLHRHARAVGADDPGRSAPAVQDLPRASPRRSPARADRSAPLNDAIVTRAGCSTALNTIRITPDWRTLGQYFARLEKQGMGINLATTSAPPRCARWCSGTTTGSRPPSNSTA